MTDRRAQALKELLETPIKPVEPSKPPEASPTPRRVVVRWSGEPGPLLDMLEQATEDWQGRICAARLDSGLELEMIRLERRSVSLILPKGIKASPQLHRDTQQVMARFQGWEQETTNEDGDRRLTYLEPLLTKPNLSPS